MPGILTLVIYLGWTTVVFDNIGLLLNVAVDTFGKHHLLIKVILDPLYINSIHNFLLSVFKNALI